MVIFMPNVQFAMNEAVIDERALLERVAYGDQAAFAQLYTVFLPLVHQYTARYLNFSRPDIEEVAQEVFLKIWKRKEAMIAVRSFEKFLFIVTRNTLTDFYRSREAGKTRENEVASFWTGAQFPAEEKTITSEYFALAKKALDLMPERRREIFELRTVQELSLEEIATLLDISVSGVHQNLRKAVSFMKEYFARHGVDVYPLLLLVGLAGK